MKGIALAVAMVCGAPALGAQRTRVEPSPAELAIGAGRFAEAENLLYAAVRRSPRDPAARGALGAYLAARGQLKAGATLLEEARQFGADEREINMRLLHIYRWEGSWDESARLSRAGIGPAEHDLLRYLATHPTSVAGPDSASVLLEPNELMGLGRVSLLVGDRTVAADVDPTVEGLVLPSRVDLVAVVQTFGAKRDTTLAVAQILRIGPITMADVPVALAGTAGARIGLDLLAQFTPTFHLGARRLTLRAKRSVAARGTEVPILLTFPGVSVVARPGDQAVPLASAAGRSAIRGARWTFDLTRGVIVVER